MEEKDRNELENQVPDVEETQHDTENSEQEELVQDYTEDEQDTTTHNSDEDVKQEPIEEANQEPVEEESNKIIDDEADEDNTKVADEKDDISSKQKDSTKIKQVGDKELKRRLTSPKAKKIISCIVVVGILLSSVVSCMASKGELKGEQRKYQSLETQYKELDKKYTQLYNKYGMYKQKMEPYETKADEDKNKQEEERKRQEEEKKRQAAEEAAKGYDTGITYDQLARNPDTYKGKKVKFEGKILQVMEDEDDGPSYRLAVGGNSDTVIYAVVPKNLVENKRILEDDWVVFSGVSYGVITYESTMGGNITIPAMIVAAIG